jgi:predicted RecB family nuclease
MSCYNKAKDDDDLSLLKGMKEREITKLNNRGIFTVKQFSYTFRPRRRRPKKVKKVNERHFHSLKALAIRKNQVYIYNTPTVPVDKIKIYLDIEGDPDRNIFYLVGLIIDDGKSLESFSFWVNVENEFEQKINEFLNTIREYHNIKVYHYGSYEMKFLKSLNKVLKGEYSSTIQRIINNSVNILSIIYPSVYFPTYSNGLKEIANYLGFNWTDEDASGLQSIIWRR